MPPTPPTLPADAQSRAPGSARGRVLPLVPGLGRPPAKGRPLPDATAVRLVVVPDSAPPYDDERDAADHDAHRAPRRLTLVTAPRATAPRELTAAAAPPGQARGSAGETGQGGQGGQQPGRHAQPDRAQPDRAQPDRAQPDRAQPGRLTDVGRHAVAAKPPPPGRLPPPGQPVPGGRRVPGRGRREQAPDVGWPGQFAQVLAETLAGSRPQGQIVPWTSGQARRRIRQLGPMLTADVQPRVRRVVTSRPTADVVEMTVVVGFGPRIRALAVRLERDGPRRASPGRPAKAARWVCTAIEAA